MYVYRPAEQRITLHIVCVFNYTLLHFSLLNVTLELFVYAQCYFIDYEQ